jgi:PAS domain-containing protein
VNLTRSMNKKLANSPFGVFTLPLNRSNVHVVNSGGGVGGSSSSTSTSTSSIGDHSSSSTDHTTGATIATVNARISKKNDIHSSEKVREELKKAKIQIEILQREKEQLINDYVKLSASSTDGKVSDASQVKLRSTNEFALDLWNPPSDLKRPIVVWNASTMELIGCNGRYRELVGYNRAELERVNMYSLMPEKLKDYCRYFMPMIMKSSTKVFICVSVIKCRRGHILIRNENHFERSFVWTNMEVLDYWDDAWVVDDIQHPATIKVSYNEELIKDIINGRMLDGLSNAFSQIMLRNSERDTNTIVNQDPLCNLIVYSQAPSNISSQGAIGTLPSLVDDALGLQHLISEQQQYSMQDNQLLDMLPELLDLVRVEQSETIIPPDASNHNQSNIYQPQLLSQQMCQPMNIQQQIFSMPGTNIAQSEIPTYRLQQPPLGIYRQSNVGPNFHEHQLHYGDKDTT